MIIEDCDFIFHQHTQPRNNVLNPIEGLIYSDNHIRIWQMYDVGATPLKGKTLVRVDIWEK